MEAEKKNLIVWDDKFAIGIPLIDKEHKKLVSLCNNLYKIIINGNSISDEQRGEAMKIALKECSDYSKYHFKHEEELMELCQFDVGKFGEHKEEHKFFTQKIQQRLHSTGHENHVSSYEFVKFLYDWILTHIAYSDRLYVDKLMKFLKEHPEIVRNYHEPAGVGEPKA